MKQKQDLPGQIDFFEIMKKFWWGILLVTFFVIIFFNLKKNDGNLSLLSEKPETHSEEILVESVGDTTQVFLQKGAEKTKISSVSTSNHSQGFKRGDFVVWLERPLDSSESFVTRYHIPTATRLSITEKGVASAPKVTTEGKVVWLEWQEQAWELRHFTGYESHEIELNVEPLHPDIYNDVVIFSRRDEKQGWATEEYSLQSGTRRVLSSGLRAKKPYFDGSKVRYLE
ncbi:MAG: hypothetical protein WAU07_00840 [Microgenomates group bacterium]